MPALGSNAHALFWQHPGIDIQQAPLDADTLSGSLQDSATLPSPQHCDLHGAPPIKLSASATCL